MQFIPQNKFNIFWISRVSTISQCETQFSRQNESVKTNNHEKRNWDERNEAISKESRGNGQEFRSFVQGRRTCEDQRGRTWLCHFRYNLSHFALHLVLFRWLVLCHPVCALLLLLSWWSWTNTLSLWMHPRKVEAFVLFQQGQLWNGTLQLCQNIVCYFMDIDEAHSTISFWRRVCSNLVQKLQTDVCLDIFFFWYLLWPKILCFACALNKLTIHDF